MITNRHHQQTTGHREGGAAWVGKTKDVIPKGIPLGNTYQLAGASVPALFRPIKRHTWGRA